LAPLPPPDWAKAKDEGFNYLVPKALLQIEVTAERGTKTNSGNGADTVSVAMRLTTTHSKAMADCSVAITRLECEGELVAQNEVLLIGGETSTTVHPRTGSGFQFVRRNMRDPITPDPFNIRLATRTLVLQENKQYVGEMELRSRYPIPTIAPFQIDTGSGLDVRVLVLKHRLAETATQLGDLVQGALAATPQPARDKPLPEALAYAELGMWGASFMDAASSAANQANEHLERFRQLAHDNELTVWGKRSESGVFEKIPPTFWAENHVEWFDLLRGRARTESRRQRDSAHDHQFAELMVSSAEFEKEWPHGR
jgi:hypothetical protein